jgi:hypothetical protein
VFHTGCCLRIQHSLFRIPHFHTAMSCLSAIERAGAKRDVILRLIRVIRALRDVGMPWAQDNVRRDHRVREFVPSAPPENRRQCLTGQFFTRFDRAGRYTDRPVRLIEGYALPSANESPSHSRARLARHRGARMLWLFHGARAKRGTNPAGR